MQKRAFQNNGKVAGFRHCNSNQTFNDLEVGTGAYDCLDGLSVRFPSNTDRKLLRQQCITHNQTISSENAQSSEN